MAERYVEDGQAGTEVFRGRVIFMSCAPVMLPEGGAFVSSTSWEVPLRSYDPPDPTG
jgi:hypothetical protein